MKCGAGSFIRWCLCFRPTPTPTNVTLGPIPSSLYDSPTVSFSAPQSTKYHYEASLFDSVDNSQVTAWTTITSGSKISGLFLLTGNPYSILIRGVNIAGTLGNATFSPSYNFIYNSCSGPTGSGFDYIGVAINKGSIGGAGGGGGGGQGFGQSANFDGTGSNLNS